MPNRTLIANIDTKGRLLYLNHHCEQILGLPLADVYGMPVWDILVAPESAQRMREVILGALAGEVVDGEETQWFGCNDTPLTVRWTCSAFRNAEGITLGAVVAGLDVGATRRMQVELAESHDRYQAILDTTVDAVITIGEDGCIESFNRAAERIFGYRAIEVLGKNVSLLMPTPHREWHDGYIHAYLTTHRKRIIGIGREVEGLRKDGTVFPMDLAVGDVTVHGHKLFTGVVRDISDRKKADQEARRRLDEIAHLTRVHSMGDLAAGLSHEINQPLTAILAQSQACSRMIRAGTADYELLLKSMEQIARQGERATEIIQRLRRYVKKGETDQQPSDIGASVSEVLSLLQHDLREHGVRIAVDIPTGLPLVLADRVQIEQVMINLIRNAMEAMADAAVPAPILVLDASPTPEQRGICVRVRDNGPGFGTKAPEELFAPFVTTKSKGLGQGLSICRRIVEAHGGRIWAESNRPNGAVFSFWLPQHAGGPGDQAA